MRAPALLPAAAALLLTAMAAPVPAGEAPPGAERGEPTQEQRAAYQRALREGRKKAAAGDLVSAMARFREALSAAPDDPAALSELGLTALRQKDYQTAEAATRKAIDASSSAPASDDKTRLRAASFYNLGLLLEERGDRPKALAAYAASLSARQNRTVRERLIGLDLAAAGAADPLAPAVMKGPFASFEAYCADVEKPSCLAPDKLNSFEAPRFTCNKSAVASAAKVAAPYLAVRIYRSTCSGDGSSILYHHLAVQTQAGWWFAADRFSAPIDTSHYAEQRRFPELTVRDVIPGGLPEVLVRSTSSGSSHNALRLHESQWEDETWLVVGMGASGKPSATSILIRQKLEDSTRTLEDDRYKTSRASADLKISFRPDGLLDIDGTIVGDIEGLADRAKLPGKHVLIFP